MTGVKRTAQGKSKIAKSTSHPDLTMLPIPENPLEEGGVLYRQYFCRFGGRASPRWRVQLPMFGN